MVVQRKAWREKLADLPATKLVFVDESGANTQMTRRYGRSPVGERLVCSVPQGHYETTTMIAAVRLTGAQAPCLFEGAMDGEMFLAWVKEDWPRYWKAGTLWGWITWLRTRWRASKRPRKRWVPAWNTFRLTRRISTRSKTCGAK